MKKLFVILLLVIACSGGDQATRVAVDTLDADGLKKLITERDGRVLLINVWATWCVPCREEFPDLIQTAKVMEDHPVDIVALSADYPTEIKDKVRPFLKNFQVNFPIYVQNFDRQEALINFLDKTWGGALPATFIYDEQGRKHVSLMGKHTSDTFVREIFSALGNSEQKKSFVNFDEMVHRPVTDL